jgi:Amt family ammonium transporter
MIPQILAVSATWILAIVGTFIVLKVVDIVMGLRLAKEEEVTGLDLSQHNESAYN